MLFELGAVLGYLYAEKYNWVWMCGKDKKQREFFFVSSPDRQFVMQPWTLLKKCLDRSTRLIHLKQVMRIPEFIAIEEAAGTLAIDGIKMISIETVDSLHRELRRLAADNDIVSEVIKAEGLL